MIAVSKNEQMVLRCIIENPDLINDIDDVFVSKVALALFNSFEEITNNKQKLTLEHILVSGNRKNAKITELLIQNLLKVNADVESFPIYYQTLREDFAKKNIYENLMEDILEKVSSKDRLSENELREFSLLLEDNLAFLEKGNEKILYNLEEIMEAYEKEFLERFSKDGLYSYGDSYLDSKITMKAHPGQITILFADTGSGKSGFDLNLVNKQINKKIPCIYVSPENDKIMTIDRLLAMRLQMPYKCLYDEELSEAMLQEIQKEKEKIKKVDTFFFVEKPDISIRELEKLIIKAKKRFKRDYLIVHVDLLSMITDFSNDLSPKNIEDKMNRVHQMVRRQGVHLIGVLQMRRNDADKKPKNLEDLDQFKPNLSGIKSAGVWAERSRVVLGMFRPKLYAQRFYPDLDETAIMEDTVSLMILKQNQGGLFNLKYIFDPEIFRFFKQSKKEEIEEEKKEF